MRLLHIRATTSAPDGVGGERHAPANLPPGNTRYPLYRRLGGPQGRSGRVRNVSSPPGFDPRIVQTVASRYTDYAISAHLLLHVAALNLVLWSANAVSRHVTWRMPRAKLPKILMHRKWKPNMYL